jgi:aminoglycoside phosphotransferase (APT) family kinase protein
MIRDRELPKYLQCIVDELAGPVRADVSSPYAQKVVDAIGLVLMRYRSQVEQDGPVSESLAKRWRDLEAGFRKAMPGFQGTPGARADTLSRYLERVDALCASIQTTLHDGAHGHENLTTALVRDAPTARSWMQAFSVDLRDILQKIEDGTRRSTSKRGTPSVASDIDRLRRSLNAYLHMRYPHLPTEPILTLAVAPGGQTKRTVLFQIAPNAALPQRLVLRQDMAFNITGTVVTDEFAILKRVFELGMPAPEPFLVEADEQILGGKFLIMREIEDAHPAGTYFPEERAYLGSAMGPDFGHDVAGALARLHSRTLEDNRAAALQSRLDRQRAVEDFKLRWHRLGKPALSLVADFGLVWLMANPLADNRPRCLIHGDVGAHNMMARGGRLAALLDWELTKMGDPAEDLSQVKMMLLPDVMPWEQFKASYIAQGGPAAACEEHPIAYFCIWTYLKHLGLNTQLWDYFMSGERDDAPAASIAGFFIDRLLLYVARALVEALETVY